MSHSSKKKKVMLGAGLACVLVAVGFASWSLLSPGPVPESAPAVSVRPALPRATPPAQAQPPRKALTPVVISEPRAPGAVQVTGRPRLPVDDLRDRMMASHPDLAQFRTLQRKVLPKPEEREVLRAIYKDREQIAVAKKELLAEDEKTFSEDNQFRRLYRVEYLGMALEWKDNPERAHVLDTVESLVSAQNILSSQEHELRRSLSGDKVELMMILLHNDRARAEQLIEASRGTEYERLLVYARTRFDALWALAKQPQQLTP
ncbi:hypothetical protein ACLESD_46295 [Pyxidicoccus sp. 3LFB2]